MTWNVEPLQERFARQDRSAEREVRQLRKKAETNDAYKSRHDRLIGAQQVFIILTTTAALSSRAALVAELQSMREREPVQTTGTFDTGRVKFGWNEALDALLKEFRQQ